MAKNSKSKPNTPEQNDVSDPQEASIALEPTGVVKRPGALMLFGVLLAGWLLYLAYVAFLGA